MRQHSFAALRWILSIVSSRFPSTRRVLGTVVVSVSLLAILTTVVKMNPSDADLIRHLELLLETLPATSEPNIILA